MMPQPTETTPAKTKRPLAQAIEDAKAFRALFPAECWQQWKGAGSVRRQAELVSDIDHVVIPQFGEVSSGDLFGTPRLVNLLWHHLDALVAGRTVEKWVRDDGRTSWGEKQRAVAFRGAKHEIWTADAENWGSILAIRTGPGDYSHRMVIALQYNGYANTDGYVVNQRDWRCRCGWAGVDPAWMLLAEARLNLDGTSVTRAPGDEKESAAYCPTCKSGLGLERVRVPVPTEEAYFKLVGWPYIAPWKRRVMP
jgi:hypothetical protein